MTNTSDLTATITETVNRYLDLIAAGTADQILELFAEGASVEDPVGTTPRVGSAEIREFFASLEALERNTTLHSNRSTS
ncbi:nuclear transport factor 2 family protein [Mycolicibacterium neworleansense]|uniref:Steroid delta-isomerase n=1 Tax=Mycolicibacterium neworleansense TaxID=146018 RepID=A0A0H5RSM9_9MYCO|nr:nuclear transport factor 2 family protein [Mycolicibacterium neworleansense]CRZ16497.1 steroid delta-isomerase [Mycolicibacterium neworleansense]